MILCDLRNLYLSFGQKELFKGAKLTLHKGDRIGLLGLNGSGKTSLFKILTKQIGPDVSTPPFIFNQFTGDENNPPFSVFYVPQEVPVPAGTTLKTFFYLFYPEFHHDNLDKLSLHQQEDMWQIENQYESYLKLFQLTDFTKELSSMSGGEQKKALLSIGLSSIASLVLWDEPTNHLDIDTIEIFEEELLTRANTFMLITHDRYLLNKVCNQILHVNRGELTPFEGSYTSYLEYLVGEDKRRMALLHRLENRLRRETDWMRQGIKARGTRSKKRVENFHELTSKVHTIAMDEYKKISLEFGSTKDERKILLKANNISFSYGDKVILKNETLTIFRGEKIGLLGKNGIGKTTLVNILTGHTAPLTGTLTTPKEITTKYFSQQRSELDLEMTPYQLVSQGGDFIDLPSGSRIHIISYLERFLFNSNEIHRPLKSFSGGERNRMLMAKNLTSGADLWIFDEPTNDLDLESLEILENTLKDFGGTVLLISHDRAFLANLTNKIWLLENGAIEQFVGGYEQVEKYMELRHIEEELQRETSKQDTKPETPPIKERKSTKKMSNQEKIRLRDLPQLIEKMEKVVEQLDQEISLFNFSERSQEDFCKLTTEKERYEEELLQAYDELEQLSS